MIRKMAKPLGWSARELGMAAVVARYHRGALPSGRKKTLQALELTDRRVAVQLAAVLRLANALDLHNGTQPSLRVAADHQTVTVQSAGYSAMDRTAEGIAAARHLLETVLHKPVLVRAMRKTIHSR